MGPFVAMVDSSWYVERGVRDNEKCYFVVQVSYCCGIRAIALA